MTFVESWQRDRWRHDRRQRSNSWPQYA